MREDRERLLHILEAIERIEKYAARGQETFRRDELIQNWMVRHIHDPRKLGDVINKLTFGGIGLGGIAKIFKEMLIY